MNYTYMKGCALCMTLCLTSAALPGRANAESSVISYIGFESQEVKVKGNAPLNIILKEDSEALDEVVVVGYGVQKKSDVTGALSSVKGDDLTKLSISRTDQALQGQMAGVMVQNR